VSGSGSGAFRGVGRVALVGAGPGAPDLLTVRAHQRLAEADLVLFDALAPQDFRPLAPEARWFYVGKRAGRESMAQEAINRLMIREARRGNDVVRLKGGDPFVLGRGGEEALALAAAGIPFEVIPGVSSAVAGPALAGIPVTHRGLASGFVVASGHAPTSYLPVLDALPPRGVTLVVLMGYAARADIAARLLARGFSSSTAAALLAGASTRDSWRWTGSLADLPSASLPPDRLAAGLPVLIVVGEVVSLAAELAPLLAAAPGASAEPTGGAGRGNLPGREGVR
jgi:uroporphyrin-III C-methyltransferase / precorrin-2 dehydrogenase / sirohydrochlorin ferrochelatase